MVDAAVLWVFIPTFLFVSATPGMCMTLALTLGMSVGVRRTLWMMIGELAGVALVAIAAVAGLAAVMLRYPDAFALFKLVGGLYLAYLGVQLWRSRGRMAIQADGQQDVGRMVLATQGFVTAVANPKGWAFMIALLPPFLNADKPLVPQMAVLLSIIMMTEFGCMLAYASGGKTLRHFLNQSGNIRLMNRIAGTLMLGVGVWLALG
ncbi:LysE family translocator [Paraferrimonas sedimenticola]|uniref:Threonine transporter RhtB n=1 Tax=Paraferrimonas sedimenticola TaxID=375674 RepID=A0AA37S079_9GAMM|nr:LysE family translocator [Paraferrimonas sedimenticola]GLP97922.1 threonine transporter RhtB [Paraferrimonas sedimenticola]